MTAGSRFNDGLTMKNLATPLPMRIYYEDTDFSGFVYHARYLHFFERGRTEFLRDLGINQHAMFSAPGGPFAFVVRAMSIEYRSPARMDDLVNVITKLTEIGAARLLLNQELVRDQTLLCSARVEIVHLAGGKPRRIPADLAQRLALLGKH
ncbi:FcbC Predicted thioesterase [Rhabdaerophilaceae bacterium]